MGSSSVLGRDHQPREQVRVAICVWYLYRKVFTLILLFLPSFTGRNKRIEVNPLYRHQSHISTHNTAGPGGATPWVESRGKALVGHGAEPQITLGYDTRPTNCQGMDEH